MMPRPNQDNMDNSFVYGRGAAAGGGGGGVHRSHSGSGSAGFLTTTQQAMQQQQQQLQQQQHQQQQQLGGAAGGFMDSSLHHHSHHHHHHQGTTSDFRRFAGAGMPQAHHPAVQAAQFVGGNSTGAMGMTLGFGGQDVMTTNMHMQQLQQQMDVQQQMQQQQLQQQQQQQHHHHQAQPHMQVTSQNSSFLQHRGSVGSGSNATGAGSPGMVGLSGNASALQAGNFTLQDISPAQRHTMTLNSNNLYSTMAAAGGGAVGGNGTALAAPPFLTAGAADGPPLPAGLSGATTGLQADREEELLLNLLIARRQRGGSREGGAHGRNPSLAEELMRMRQQGQAAGGGGTGASSMMQAAAASFHPSAASSSSARTSNAMPSSASGMSHALFEASLPPVSNVMPDAVAALQHHQHQAAAAAAAARAQQRVNARSHLFSDSASSAATNAFARPNTITHLQEHIHERIDRSPTRLIDARSQEMIDYSGRGIKRSAAGTLGGGGGHVTASFDAASLKFQAAMGMHAHPQHHLHGMHGMHDADAMMPKKKRKHKKKPLDMPRRPLSAYNLFFSEERERILKEIDAKESGGDADEQDEDKDEKPGKGSKKKDEDDVKPKALMRPLIPAQKKRRPHRKTHGKISFQELARMVGERWKNLSEERRKYYQDLAKEDMKRQKEAMEEYYAKQNEAKGSSSGVSKLSEAEDQAKSSQTATTADL